MDINYKVLDKYSEENKDRISKFVILFKNLIEIYGSTIPFSAFIKGGFDIDEIQSFIKIVNSLILIVENRNIEMQEYWYNATNPIYRYDNLLPSSGLFLSTFGIRSETLKTTLYLKLLYSDTIEVLDIIIKEIKRDVPVKENKEKVKDKYIQNIKDSSEVLYKITFGKNREIKLNGKLLSKPNFNSENDNVFEYIFNNSNRKITKEEIENFLKIKLKKKFDRIIMDLGFKGNLKRMFFPNISINAIEFINPITKEYIKNNKIIVPKDIKAL